MITKEIELEGGVGDVTAQADNMEMSDAENPTVPDIQKADEVNEDGAKEVDLEEGQPSSRKLISKTDEVVDDGSKLVPIDSDELNEYIENKKEDGRKT